jgi:hypothetical protein
MPQSSLKSSPYSVHPGVAMVQAWIASLPGKTGRTLEEWVQLLKKAGPPTEKERRQWLKAEHGFGTNHAWWIAQRADGKGWEDGDPDAYLHAAAGYVEAMYAGPKAGLRPIHDALLMLGKELGDDVKVCPCQTIVPLYRQHVFAQIKPTTQTRIDFGLALKDTPATGRLIDTGGLAKGDRITHRIAITSLGEIDGEVERCLKVAYDLDGEPASAKKPARTTDVVVPDDLRKALKRCPGAEKAFAAMPPSHQREYISHIDSAKRPETRARRIEQSVQKMMANQKE